MKCQLIATTILLLFIGVAVAPSINVGVVKASNDTDLVEVTSEACSIKGYGNTTVKLTKQQYQNLEQYLVDFRARLNTTSTREEAVPIFNEAVVELNKYGLLPKGMSIQQTQKLVTAGTLIEKTMKWLEKLFNRNKDFLANNSNYICLIAGETNLTFTVHRYNYWLLYGGYIFEKAGLDIWYFFSENYPLILPIISLLFPLWLLSVGVCWLGAVLQELADKNPIALIDVFGIGYYNKVDEKVYYGSGWLKSVGLLGVKSWDGAFLGNLPGLKIPHFIDVEGGYGYQTLVYPAIWDFSGIKIRLDDDGSEKFFLGSALAVGLDTKQ